MGTLMQQGQALSTWSFSGSATDTGTLLFNDNRDSDALRPIRVQGFVWTGAATLTVTDPVGLRLFSGANTLGLWPVTASGSFGIITNAPLTMAVGTTPGGGGRLTIYGEVL